LGEEEQCQGFEALAQEVSSGLPLSQLTTSELEVDSDESNSMVPSVLSSSEALSYSIFKSFGDIGQWVGEELCQGCEAVAQEASSGLNLSRLTTSGFGVDFGGATNAPEACSEETVPSRASEAFNEGPGPPNGSVDFNEETPPDDESED
jgi:hypothetical protein